jgi:hypothetical protein
MNTPNIRVQWVPWHSPIRLAIKTDEGLQFIGWVWRERAYQIRNIHHGWIALVEHQTNLKPTCPTCGKSKE